jgi:predicted nucleic acid-binding protein
LSGWAILDTTVYVGFWQRSLYAAEIDAVHTAFVVRHSAVVLSELRRGARTAAAERMVVELRRRSPEVWVPTESDWWEAGRLSRALGDARDWDRTKRHEFQNDALIALSARNHGATVVTANRRDFELLGKALRLPLVVL